MYRYALTTLLVLLIGSFATAQKNKQVIDSLEKLAGKETDSNLVKILNDSYKRLKTVKWKSAILPII